LLLSDKNSLFTNYTIKSLFECHYALYLNLHYLLLNKVTLKQRLKIKSSIIDANNHLNVVSSFNSWHKELSPGFCLVDIFQNHFSFNSVDQKVNEVNTPTSKNLIKPLKILYKIPRLLLLYQMLTLKITLLHQSLIFTIVIL